LPCSPRDVSMKTRLAEDGQPWHPGMQSAINSTRGRLLLIGVI
jgi:hypothetical protein